MCHPLLETHCARCRRDGRVLICSKFNTEMICLDCKDVETFHPDYHAADLVEVAACRAADYNFCGVGLPVGYSIWASQQRRERR